MQDLREPLNLFETNKQKMNTKGEMTLRTYTTSSKLIYSFIYT